MFQGTQVIDGQIIPNGYQQITSLSSATSPTVPAGTKTMIIQAESQSVRWRDDGTSPTASVGMVITPDSYLVYNAVHAGTGFVIKFIEVTASAKLNISYYK